MKGRRGMSDDKEVAARVTHEKRNKKLLVQVGLIVAGIFILVIACAAAILVKGSLNTYFRGKEEIFEGFLNQITDEALNVAGPTWLFDFFEEHPEEVRDSDPTENDQSLWNFQMIRVTKGDFENEKLAGDYLNSLTFEEQLSYAQCMFDYMNDIISVYKWFMPSEDIILFDPNGEKGGFVFSIAEMTMTSATSGLGTYVDYKPEEHPALKKIINGKADLAFEQYHDKESDEYLYIGFKAIKFSGKLCGVLAIIHPWTDVHSDVMRMELIMVLVIGGALIILAVLLLLFLNHSVIRPVTKVKQGVREYIQDKDSSRIVEEMSQIKQKNELGDLADDIAEMAVEIDKYNEENIRLYKDREKLATEMDFAARIQMDVLPKKFPEHDAFEIFASMDPAKDVGGDFYDFFFIGETQLGMVIADVSDKGVPAALFMMVSKRLIREYATSGLDLKYVMEEANNSLCEGNENQMFVTAWVGILDLTTGEVRAVSAGHEYPMLKLESGKFEILKDRHGPALGTMEGMSYREYSFMMPKDGTLFVYTDGAPEATNKDKEMFGMDRMIEALNEDPELSPVDLIAHMTKSINAFVGDAPQFDDLTMLSVKYKGMDY